MATFGKISFFEKQKKFDKDKILDGIFESTTTPVFVIDKSHSIIIANAAAKQFFSLNDNAPEKMEFSQLFEITKEDADTLFQRVFVDSQSENRQFLVKGNRSICKVNMTPICEEEEQYLVAYVYDRTDDYRTIENLKNVNLALEKELHEKTKEVENIALSAITTIANFIDSKEEYNFGHSTRVAKYAEAIAREIGWSAEEALNVHYVALLHDIGKIGVPLYILNKPSPLSEEEQEIIREHARIGAEILKDIKTVRDVSNGALYHHERYDGTGYPEGLKGQEIPLVARIIGIADAYDAMTSERDYKEILTKEEVRKEIESNIGTQFDPYIASAVCRMIDEGVFEGIKGKKEDMSTDNILIESNALMAKVLGGELESTREETQKDYLTQLWNRHNGEKHIKEYLRLGDGALMIINLDDFNKINESYGYTYGDYVLKEVADVLRSHGKNEYVFRIEGDEFLVFVRDVITAEETQPLLDAIMFSFNCRKEVDEVLAHTSLSIGIALSSVEGREYKKLLRCADRALYYVKQTQKGGYSFHNKVVAKN